MQEIDQPENKTKGQSRVIKGQVIANKKDLNIDSLYEHHAAKLLGLIIGIVRCPLKANDILIRTFLNAKQDIKFLNRTNLNEFILLFRFAVREMRDGLPEWDEKIIKQKMINLINYH